MTNQDNRSKAVADLRQKAEALARERAVRISEDCAALSPEEIRRMFHKLRVHQIELELQNEELRTAHAEIKAGRAISTFTTWPRWATAPCPSRV